MACFESRLVYTVKVGYASKPRHAYLGLSIKQQKQNIINMVIIDKTIMIINNRNKESREENKL